MSYTQKYLAAIWPALEDLEKWQIPVYKDSESVATQLTQPGFYCRSKIVSTFIA